MNKLINGFFKFTPTIAVKTLKNLYVAAFFGMNYFKENAKKYTTIHFTLKISEINQ